MSIETVAADRELTAAEKLTFMITDLIKGGHKGAALNLARRGWRDFPNDSLPHVGSFAQLTTMLASMVEGGVAAPADPEESAVAPVSAAPVSAAPVSAAPVSAAPVSAAPVSAAPIVPVSPAGQPGPSAAIVIERTVDNGTIIRLSDDMPKLLPIIGDLGWRWSRRMNLLWLGDRNTAPRMDLIAATLGALGNAGILASSTVRGDEPAKPVSAAPVSPAATRKPTTRQTAKKFGPVVTRQVSAPAAPVFQPPAPVAPVSAPAAPAAPDALSQILAALSGMQQQIDEIKSGAVAPAPVAPAPAPAPAPVAPVVAVQQAVPSTDDILASLAPSQELAEVLALTWTFKLTSGAKASATATEIRQDLRARVSDWWAHHHLGQVTFSVYAKNGHVFVNVATAAGEIGIRTLKQQVVGTVLGVKGISGTSTVKREWNREQA